MSGKTYCLIWIDIPFTTRLPGKQYNNNFPSVWFENNLSVLTASGDMKLHCFPDSCKYSGLIYLCKYFLCKITTNKQLLPSALPRKNHQGKYCCLNEQNKTYSLHILIPSIVHVNLYVQIWINLLFFTVLNSLSV